MLTSLLEYEIRPLADCEISNLMADSNSAPDFSYPYRVSDSDLDKSRSINLLLDVFCNNGVHDFERRLMPVAVPVLWGRRLADDFSFERHFVFIGNILYRKIQVLNRGNHVFNLCFASVRFNRKRGWPFRRAYNVQYFSHQSKHYSAKLTSVLDSALVRYERNQLTDFERETGILFDGCVSAKGILRDRSKVPGWIQMNETAFSTEWNVVDENSPIS